MTEPKNPRSRDPRKMSEAGKKGKADSPWGVSARRGVEQAISNKQRKEGKK